MRLLLRKMKREQILFHGVWTSDLISKHVGQRSFVRITEVEQVSLRMKKMAKVN